MGIGGGGSALFLSSLSQVGVEDDKEEEATWQAAEDLENV